MSVATKAIDWDTILETYGPDAKIALTKLLTEAQILESDPAALVIAAMFISQIDTNRAFQSITETIDNGKQALSAQFTEQVLQLRGVVAYAEEHLVNNSEQQIEARKEEMLQAIKAGVAKVLDRKEKDKHSRTMLTTGMTIACTALVSLLSMGAGALVMHTATGDEDSAASAGTVRMEGIPHGDIWLSIAEANQQQLSTCLENAEQLEGRCAVTIPR